MSDVNYGEEYFATEAEAQAFQTGMEYFDDEHTIVEAPEPADVSTNDENHDKNWVVRFRRFA